MNRPLEIVEKGMPARHASKARRAGHRVIAGGRSEPHLNSTLQSPTGEDARLPTPLPTRRAYRPEGRAYSSERRTVISAVAEGHS